MSRWISTSARSWAAVGGIAFVALSVDQLTKSWARGALENGRIIDLPGSLQLVLAYNSGIAFGLGKGVAPLLVTVAVIGLIVLLLSKRSNLDRASVLGVGLVLGGAFGNLCDRLFRDTGGAVVDFIDLQWWPVFNLADACIVIGAAIIVLSASRVGGRETPDQMSGQDVE